MAEVPLYRSTRGSEGKASFEEALLHGLAMDGGLYVPTFLPRMPEGWEEADSFPDLGVRVLESWLAGPVPSSALEAFVRDALSFPVPLVPLQDTAWDGVFVLELFHGPTLSFKDFGARMMARLMTYFLRERSERATILVATSGDTGSAVADGFAGSAEVDVRLLYPKGQVSPTQERQLIVARPGVRAFAVRGAFDDCQRMVKEAFVDRSLDGLRLTSANSINIGRLLPQMLYYFEAFRQGGFGEAVVCVPSGNLGNLTAGLLASLSGLPATRFIAAHNANDFFPSYLREGTADSRPSVRTLSNAMDVGVPSNFERLQSLFPPRELERRLWATSVSDAETIASIRRVYEDAGYVADPHTAVGLEAARRFRSENGGETPTIVLATAHPAKFPEIVQLALGFEIDQPGSLEALWAESTFAEEIDPNLPALRHALLQSA